MSKGLERILDKISDDPRQTLIGRYLSLIADITEEDERAGFALDLAERLVKLKPDDALKIAYMVYDSGRHLVRSLRLVIKCFEAKGRAGKVAVLRLELEKVERELEIAGAESSLRPQKPLPPMNLEELSRAQEHAFGDEEPKPGLNERPRELTKMAELDLSDIAEDSRVSDSVDLLFGDREPAGKENPQADEAAHQEQLKMAEGLFAGFAGRPGDTVLPMVPDGKPQEPSGTVISVVRPPHRDQPAKTVNLEGMPRITLGEGGEQEAKPRPSHQIPSDTSALEFLPTPSHHPLAREKGEPFPLSGKNYRSIPADVFDRLFAAEKFSEAEAVLEANQGERDFEWWRSRLAQLDAVKRFIGKKGERHQGDASSKSEMNGYVGDLRKGVRSEILFLEDHLEKALVEQQLANTARHNTKVGSAESIQVIKDKLQQILTDSSGETSITARENGVAFIQSLAPGLPSEVLIKILEEFDLCYGRPSWFGIYLDALLASGYARKVIAEVVLLTNRKGAELSLNWLRVVWPRLVKAWDGMHLNGFVWSEDDGVAAFRSKIVVRPERHFLAIA